MSEIMVMIPLTVFGDAESLTPQAISEAITAAADSKQQVAQLEATVQGLKDQIRSGGRHLEEILENPNQFEKAQQVRKLIADMKEFQ